MSSSLMIEFPNFEDFLKTQSTYDDVRKGLDFNPNAISIVSRLSLNLPVINREKLDLPKFPEAWKDMFKECESEIMNAMTFVNSQIKLGKTIFPLAENLFRAFITL